MRAQSPLLVERHGVTDLLRDLRPLLIGGQNEVVGDAHAARRLADRDGPILGWVEVTTFSGL